MKLMNDLNSKTLIDLYIGMKRTPDSIKAMSYKEKQKHYKSIVNRENSPPKYPEGKRIILREDLITERLIQNINILPYISSDKDMHNQTLIHHYKLQADFAKAEKEMQEMKRVIEELTASKDKCEKKIRKIRKTQKLADEEINRLNSELDIANNRIIKLKTNNKIHREKVLQF